jgi:glycosyltransferase involved in cell wall biosynthesis
LHSFSRLQYLLPLLPGNLPKIMSYQRQPTMRTVSWASRLGGKYLTFTGCSEHIAQQGRQASGRWHSIHNGIELDRYVFQPQVKADAPLVFLSRLERIKGVHQAIAIALATSQRLLIAGNRVSSPEGEHYWQTVIAPHLNHAGIEYIGPVNDQQKNQLLGQAAAMIVPIEWDEPFGIVFAEALACGTPVISSPRGALPEIVRSGIDGFLVNSTDEAISAIQQLAQIDRHHCRERAESCFSAAVIVDQYESLYHQVCV